MTRIVEAIMDNKSNQVSESSLMTTLFSLSVVRCLVSILVSSKCSHHGAVPVIIAAMVVSQYV